MFISNTTRKERKIPFLDHIFITGPLLHWLRHLTWSYCWRWWCFFCRYLNLFDNSQSYSDLAVDVHYRLMMRRMSWKRSWSWSALLLLGILQSSCCKSELSSSSLSLCSSCVTPQNLFNVVVKFNQIDSLHQPLIECNPVDHLSSGFLSKCELLTALLFWPSTCLFRQLGNFSSWHWTTIGEEVLQSYWHFRNLEFRKTWLCFHLWMVIMSGQNLCLSIWLSGNLLCWLSADLEH